MEHKEFVICLAEVPIAIQPLYDEIEPYCKDYIADCPPELRISATQGDIDAERKISRDEDILEGIPVRHFSDGYLETLAVYRKIAVALLSRGILLFHGSCIAVDGVAYLFTAKSGTGKSTHVNLWRQRFGSRAITVNDDKPLLRIGEAGVTAYGTPWDGKHRLSTNMGCPLKAICILQRSGTNQIQKITPREGYALFLQQTYRPKEPVALAQTLHLLDRLLSRVELYRLGCNMDPEAAAVSYRGMNGEKTV